MSLALAGALGLGLGVVTGMPLGVVNVAIVDAAVSGRRRFAIGIGLGGALADTVHAALAFVGVGRAVTSRPELVQILAVGAAVLIGGYALASWRRRTAIAALSAPPIGDAGAPSPARPPPTAAPVAGGSVATRMVAGVATGAALTLPNPGALAAWVAIASSLLPTASVAEAVAVALGVGVGSALWFTLLARWSSRLPRHHAAVRLVPRIALVALVGLASYGLVRTFTA